MKGLVRAMGLEYRACGIWGITLAGGVVEVELVGWGGGLRICFEVTLTQKKVGVERWMTLAEEKVRIWGVGGTILKAVCWRVA